MRILVDTKVTSYSEVLKKLKDGLGESAENFTAAKKSLAGNMVVEVARGTDHAHLLDSIVGLVGGDRVKSTDSSKGLIEIKGLGKETSSEEVREVVKKHWGQRGTRK